MIDKVSASQLARLENSGAKIGRQPRMPRVKRNLPRTTVDNDHEHGILDNGRTTIDQGHDHELLPSGRTSFDKDHDHKWGPKIPEAPKPEPPVKSLDKQVDNTDTEMVQKLIEHNRLTLERFSTDLRGALAAREKKPLDLTFEIIRDETVRGDYQPITGLRLKSKT